MIFADAGHLVALLKPRDGLHPRAVAWEEATRSARLLTTEAVLTELLDAMAGGHDREKAILAAEYFRDHPDHLLIGMSTELFQRALTRYRERPDQAWGLTDCISFLVMEEHGVTQALAHDHHFEQAGFEALLRREP